MFSFLVMKLDLDLGHEIALCIYIYQFRNMTVSYFSERTSAFHSLLSSAVSNRSQIINGIVGRCIHQQVTCVSHRALNDECLVHNGSWTCPDNATEPSESPLPNLLNQVETGRERTGVSRDRPTCNSRKHCTVSTIKFAHCIHVKVPCLTSMHM